MRKRGWLLLMVGVLSLASTMTSLAGWEQVGTQWKYKDGEIYLAGWQWIDGNGDGVAECYYLDDKGVMVSDVVVDGYSVNSSGAWEVDGIVQTKIVSGGGSSSSSQSSQTSESGSTGNNVKRITGSVGYIAPEKEVYVP